MKQAIGYVRVSSEEQAESGLGLEAQRQRIVAFCDMKGLRCHGWGVTAVCPRTMKLTLAAVKPGSILP